MSSACRAAASRCAIMSTVRPAAKVLMFSRIMAERDEHDDDGACLDQERNQSVDDARQDELVAGDRLLQALTERAGLAAKMETQWEGQQLLKIANPQPGIQTLLCGTDK